MKLDEASRLLSTAGIDPASLRVANDVGDRQVLELRRPPGPPTVETWWALRHLYPQTGLWPVCTGFDYGEPFEELPEPEIVEMRLRRAAKRDGRRWLRAMGYWRREHLKWYQGSCVGRWNANLVNRFVTMSRFGASVFQDSALEMVIHLIPVPVPYLTPAHLQVGNFNSSPSPAVHCGVLKYWYERYGAEPGVVLYNTVEAYVPRPPRTYDAAYELAIEQLCYTNGDLTDEFYNGSLENHALHLIDNTTWYLWWD